MLRKQIGRDFYSLPTFIHILGGSTQFGPELV
jgi:hypothetical protein